MPGGAANASSFTLAFDAASGCFTVGAGAACDTANGHCCVGTAAPTPPKFRFLLIKPSSERLQRWNWVQRGAALQLVMLPATPGRAAVARLNPPGPYGAVPLCPPLPPNQPCTPLA